MTGTDPTGTGSRVTVAEIAAFLRQLRDLSQPTADPTRDSSAERDTFLARRTDLFTRIAVEHPDPTPPTTAPPTTAPPTTAPPTTAPPTTRPDGGRA